MAAVDVDALRRALLEWRSGRHGPLLRTLGYDPTTIAAPHESLPDFGLRPDAPVDLQVVGRSGGFLVFRLRVTGPLDPETVRRHAASLYRHNPGRRALLVFDGDDRGQLVFASWGLGPGPLRLRKMWLDPREPRPSELDILAGLHSANGAAPAELALAHARALDRERVTRRFFVRFSRKRAELATALHGVPTAESRDRLDLALILLSRLLFLYFVQRKGWLAGDSDYLRSLYTDSIRSGVPFFKKRLAPLFFGALNRPPAARRGAAAGLGALPYLNGGLFERHALERRYPRLNVPNTAFAPIFVDLFDRYQFTLREDQPEDQDVAVDPEMLGKVFEGLMAGPVRSSTGSFYTPRALVDRAVDGALTAHLTRATGASPGCVGDLLAGAPAEITPAVRRALAESLRDIRILDPAVGSGAFLLAALDRLESLHDALEGPPRQPLDRFRRRQEIIRRNLFGVDISATAVRLCELRLWLGLVVDLEASNPDDVPPLPNLDFKIRQGDVLSDPVDFLLEMGDLDDRNLAVRWRRTARRLERRRARYFEAAGPGKRRVGRLLARVERDLALGFLGELRDQLGAHRRDLRAARSSPDLFGERAGLTAAAGRALARIERRLEETEALCRRVRELDELPFFSFAIHFAHPERPDRGFDIVVGNPPWVRPHRWRPGARAHLKQRFGFLREAGWRIGARLTGTGRGFAAQLDLSALFLERGLGLLATDGALCLILPAKHARALYAGAVRERLVRTTRLIALEDASLAPSPFFRASTYPMALLLTTGPPPPGHRVRVTVRSRSGEPLDFRVPQADLPLWPDDPASPWALAPPTVRPAIARMHISGRPVGLDPDRRPRRGVFTGANSLFVGAIRGDAPGGSVELALPVGEIAIEKARLRPVVRGSDLRPWRFRTPNALVWTHDDEGRPTATLPPLAAAHFRSHRPRLRARRGLRPGQPDWALFRVDPAKFGLRVAWRDIGTEPSAVVLPAGIDFLGAAVPVVSLNTVYQIPVTSEEEAHFIAAVLNSLVGRVYLKTIAERAAGSHFRFLGWTVGLLPLPSGVEAAPLRAECARASRRAHRDEGLSSRDRDRLDRAVGRLYGLSPDDLAALRAFERTLAQADHGS